MVVFRSTLRATAVYLGLIKDRQVDATSPAHRAPPHIRWQTMLLGAALGTALAVGGLVVLGVSFAEVDAPWLFPIVFAGAMAVRAILGRVIDLFRQRP